MMRTSQKQSSCYIGNVRHSVLPKDIGSLLSPGTESCSLIPTARVPSCQCLPDPALVPQVVHIGCVYGPETDEAQTVPEHFSDSSFLQSRMSHRLMHTITINKLRTA